MSAKGRAQQRRTQQERGALPFAGPVPLHQILDAAGQRPIRTGFLVAAGGLLAAALWQLVLAAGGLLVLVLLAIVLAAGLEPLVLRLQRHLGVPRRTAARLTLFLVFLGATGTVTALVLPAVHGLADLVRSLPTIAQDVQKGNGALGGLARRLSLQQRAQDLVGQALRRTEHCT